MKVNSLGNQTVSVPADNDFIPQGFPRLELVPKTDPVSKSDQSKDTKSAFKLSETWADLQIRQSLEALATIRSLRRSKSPSEKDQNEKLRRKRIINAYLRT